MSLSLRPHEYRREADTNLAKLTRLNPYIRIRKIDTADEPAIFLQGGAFYYADGTEIEKPKLPAWALEEVKKLTPRALKEVGFDNANLKG